MGLANVAESAAVIAIVSLCVLLATYLTCFQDEPIRRQNRKTITEQFAATLRAHGMSDARIISDKTKLGGRNRLRIIPFEVYRTLNAEPDRWFAYTHVQGSEPVLTPISEQRALIAART